MRGLRLHIVAALVVVLAALGLAAPALAVDNFNPATVNVTLEPGQSQTVSKSLHLDALPGAADIIIAIDTTGSMSGAIAQAKAQATALCTNVQAQIPAARFAVIDFKDVPDRPATNGLLILTPVFTGDCTAIQTAINTMSASGGGDFAEAYNWVFNAAWANAVLDASRNANAVQFLVVLGDAPPHNVPAPTVSPTCGNQPPADAGITSDSEIAALNTNEITLLMIRFNNSIPLTCYSGLAGATGGTAVNSGGDLSGDIISQIQEAAAHIDEVALTVTGVGCQTAAGPTITFNPPNPPPYGPFTAPVDIPFTETISVPAALPLGDYTCIVTAVVDGTVRAREIVNVHVRDLTPPTGTCEPTTNPSGGNIPSAGDNPASGQNPDGFYVLHVTDNLDPNPQIFIHDSGSSAVFGPFPDGTKIKLTQAPGATPSQKPGAGVIDWKIKLNGDAELFFVDASGNTSGPVSCLVPPPPK